MTTGVENTDLQGLKTVELYKLVWTKTDRIILFAGLLLLNWAITFEANMNFALSPKVLGYFGTQNLISLLPTVLYILQTALLPMYSKLSNMYGRAQCYTVSMIIYMVAFIVYATSRNYYNFVGGQIVYAFGYSGVFILGPITIADVTNVVDRGLYQALYNLPSLISIFTAPLAGTALANQGKWRWAYGMIPIILFVCGTLVVGTLWRLTIKANKSEAMKEFKAQQKAASKAENLSIIQKIVWFVVEIDIVGSFLLVAGLTLILLPLVLALPSWGGWSSGITIGTLVAGVVTWGLFGIWEWKFAAKPFVPLGQWETRTPLYGILALSTVTLISSTAWQFLTIYLVIARRIDFDYAVLLERGYNIAYLICEVAAGYMMKRTRVWRPFVWGGVSLIVLGVGLMIPARLPHSSNAFVVISQAIVGMGSGFLFTPMLVAIQSSVPHGDMAVATGLMQVGGSIAGSIGSTMAGTIWNNMLPGQLAKHVPGEYDYATIVGSSDAVLKLPLDQYNGVVEAYGYIQMILSIIAMCIAVLTFCFTIPMKSFGLENSSEKSDTAAAGSDSSEHSTHVEKTNSCEEVLTPKYEVEQKL